MEKSIFIIGYRATGKTIVGKQVAAMLNMDFLDLDKFIEQDAGMNISQIVAKDGWTSFRAMEKKALQESILLQRPKVISCGGGAIIHKEIWPKIKQNNVIILLKASPNTILTRLKNDTVSKTQRPRLIEEKTSLKNEITNTLQERLPLYGQWADIEIDTDTLTPDQVAQKIIEEVIS